MHHTIRTTALLLLAAACFLPACKEDDPTPVEILTAGDCWKITLLEGYDSANKLWISVPVEDCLADNCLTFKADQTMIADEGASKCDAADPQSAEGSWSLSEDASKLSLTEGGETETGTIVELSSGKLVYEADLDGEKIRLTLRAN
jgi:hypothetical protein